MSTQESPSRTSRSNFFDHNADFKSARKEEKKIDIDISQTDKFEILRILRAAREEILTAQKKESAMGRSQKRKESNINDEILSQTDNSGHPDRTDRRPADGHNDHRCEHSTRRSD